MLLEKYGLKLIPFKSQGSESGKYPFVPSESFNNLISEIQEIREDKDAGSIIFRGPQGSGKTATRNGILNNFLQQTDVGIIAVNLSSLELRDLTWSIANNAKKQNLIDDKFLKEIDYVEGQNIERPRLLEIIISIIEKILSVKEFGILIVDEFDIISQPTFHDTTNQTTFLQNITNLLNLISESKMVQKKSFCTILAQTDKSSEDFITYVASRHKPLASRLKRSVDIEYNLDETKQIILNRLKSEQIAGFVKPDGNEFFPLDEKIIEFLFIEINQLTLKKKMTAFRDVEQILHNSIVKSLEKNLPKVEIDIVMEIFNQEKTKLFEIKREELRINKETIIELDKLLLDKDHSAANNLYLEGIKSGMTVWESQLYKTVDSNGARSRLIPDNKHSLFINSIRLDIQSSSKHHKSIFWYNVSKFENEQFTDKDFEEINLFLDKNKDERNGCQFSILTIFSDTLLTDEIQLKNDLITSMDEIFIRNNIVKKAIIGIAISNSATKDVSTPSDDREQFKPNWNTHLHSVCTDKLGETLHDLDKEFSDKNKVLVQILFTKSAIGETLQKKADLKNLAKGISNLNIQENNVNEIILLGFCNEELQPSIPRNLVSLKNLIELGKTSDEILTFFSKPFTFEAAKLLNIIDDDGKLVNFENLKKEIEDDYIQKMKDVLPEDTTTLSVNQKIIKLLVDAFEKIDEITNYLKKVIVLGYIREQSEKSLEDLSVDSTFSESDASTTESDASATDVRDTAVNNEKSEEITLNMLLDVCNDVLKDGKLTLNELRKRISMKPRFEDETKWVTKIYALIRSSKISLSKGN